MYLVVQLKALLSRRNGSKHRLSIDPTLDVGGCAQFIAQHLLHS